MRRALSGRVRRSACASAALAALTRPLAAQPTCPSAGRPFVELSVEVEPPDQFIADSLARHLDAELAARGIDVCRPVPRAEHAVARLRLRVDHPARGAIVATVDVVDAVTDKRLERTMNLTRLPAEVRPAAVASAADELLRASWAELAVADAPPPPAPPPAVVVRAVEASMRRGAAPGPAPIEVGALVEASSFFGYRSALGADVLGAWWAHPRVALTLRAGAALGLARSSEHGAVRANTGDAGLGLALALSPRQGPFGIDLEAGLTAVHVGFDASPVAGARAQSGSLWAAVFTGGLRGWARSGPLRWVLGADALLPPSPVVATDAGRPVTSVEGIGIELSAGVVVSL